MATNPVGFNLHSGAQYGPPTGGSMGNYNFGNTMNPNPSTPNAQINTSFWGPPSGAPPSTGGFDPGTAGGGMTPAHTFNFAPGGGMSGGPTVSTNPGGDPGSSNVWNTLGLPTSGQGNEWQFAKELGATYGEGTGSALFQYLQKGAGYNSALTDQAVQAQTAAMQHQAQQGWGNIASQLGAQGIDPNSSVNALASSNYWSGVTSQENALAAQEYYNMWSQSSGQEAGMLQSILGGTQQHQQKKDAFWGDVIGTGLQFATAFI